MEKTVSRSKHDQGKKMSMELQETTDMQNLNSETCVRDFEFFQSGALK